VGVRTSDLLVTSLSERLCEPLQTLVKTISGGSASGLNVPSTLSQAVQTQLICDLCGVHGIWQILLVGEYQKNGISELILVQHTLQLLTSLDNTVTIVTIDNEDDTLSVLEVMSPQRTDLVLATDIPHGELDVLVLDSLDVEADGGNRGDDLAELQLVKDCGLPGCVETNHQDAHVALPKELRKDLTEKTTHRF